VLYGRTLLHHVPEGTTDLLIELCSGTLGKKLPITANLEQAKANGPGGPAMLSYLGYNRVAGMFTGDAPAGASSGLASDARPAQTQPNGDGKGARVAEPGEVNGLVDALASAVDDEPTYEPPSPRQYFAHFVDHRDQFERFLESVAATLWNQIVPRPSQSRQRAATEPLSTRGSPPADDVFLDPVISDQRAVWNTLLEIYLSTLSSTSEAVSTASRQKALGLLQSQLPYDPMHALILCSTADFTDGLVGLWENMGMYEDVLRWYMAQPPGEGSPQPNGTGNSNGDSTNPRHPSASAPAVTSSSSSSPSPSDEVLRYLALYGPTNHHLYPLVLRYLTSSPQILSRHAKQLPELLETIDELRIMPPLAVVQLLSRNGVASVGTVKEWLKVKVAETRQDVESVRKRASPIRCSHPSRSTTTIADSASRTNTSFKATDRRLLQGRKRLWILPTQSSQRSSKSHDARRVAANSTSQACTSCASTRIISGESAWTWGMCSDSGPGFDFQRFPSSLRPSFSSLPATPQTRLVVRASADTAPQVPVRLRPRVHPLRKATLGHTRDPAEPDESGGQTRPVPLRGARGGRWVWGRGRRVWEGSHGEEGRGLGVLVGSGRGCTRGVMRRVDGRWYSSRMQGH
jgi:hypothetical protein